jgi:transcriptional regulator with XRE-family HTH domain
MNDGRYCPSLGAAIKARRLELGLSQEELAARVAVQDDPSFRQSGVSRLERDRVELPRRGRLQRIAVALELSLSELFARSGWEGADVSFAAEPRTMFQDAVPTCSTRPAALPQLLQSSTETSDHELVYISDFSHLHQSVARSHTLIAQSRAIAAQSRALCDRYERQHLSFVNERAAPSAACSCSVHHSPTVHAPIDRSTMTPLPSETKTAGSVNRRRRRTTTRSVWRMVSREPGRIRCPCAKRRRPLIRSRLGVDSSRGRALHSDTLSSRC